MTIPPLERATDEFAALLTRWRAERGMSKRALAIAMGFDPSYVSHIEGRRHRPTEDFARRAEQVLDAGGVIWESYASYEALRRATEAGTRPPTQRTDPETYTVPGIGLVVEREHAALGLRDDRYHIVIRRLLHNVGAEPVIRYPVRIRVDRFPNHPRRSARFHHGAPLTFTELGFTAQRLSAVSSNGQPGLDDTFEAEPMTWRATYDADSVKELWLEFTNGDGHFPLYPGQRSMIEYAYHVGSDKWGPWFGRTIRFPTRELHLDLDFPTETRPAVWGTVSSLGVYSAPLATPLRTSRDAERTTFAWSVRAPVLGARYRFEWRLRDLG